MSVNTTSVQVQAVTLPNPNPLPNTANVIYTYTADPSVPDGERGSDLSNTVLTEVNVAELDVVKSVDPIEADVGDTLTYAIVISNSGNVSATNVTFSDTIPNDTTLVTNSVTENGVTIPGADPESGVSLNDIPGGGVTTVTFQVIVDMVPSPNPIPNQASLDWNYTIDPSVPDGASGSSLSNIPTSQISNADLDLDKDVDTDFAVVGETLTYTVVITNSGNVTATNVVFSDTIPNGTSLVANSFIENGVTIPGADPNTGVSLNDIPAGSVTTITFLLTVDTIPSPNPIQNSADAAWTYTVEQNNPDGASGRDTSNTIDTEVNDATLTTVKSVDNTTADIGDTLTYTIVITNSGNATANNVVFSDTIPGGTTLVANSVTENGLIIPGANPQNGVNLQPIPGGSITTVTFQVVVDTIPTPNPVPNTGDVAWTFTLDPSIPNGESGTDTSNTVETQVNHAEVDVDKSSNTNFANLGDTLTYTVVLTNTGNVTADNVVITDTIPNGTTFVTNSVTINGVVQPGESPAPPTGLTITAIGAGEVVTVTYSVTVDTIPSPNPIPNQAVANYDYTVGPNDVRSDANASEVNEVDVNNADLDLVKSVDNTTADIGDTLTYTIVITNVGNITANNVVFSDTIPEGTTFVNNSFTEDGAAIPGANPQSGVNLQPIPGGGVTTVTFQVVVDTIPSVNPIPNSGDAAWTFTLDPSVPDGESGRDTSDTVRTQVNHAEVEVEKSSNTNFADVGDTLTYTVVLRNTGNVAADNVVVTDTIPNGTTLVPNSVTINGVVQPGESPEPPTGISIVSINAGEVVTITYSVTVDTIPSPNPIPNQAAANYDYTVGPNDVRTDGNTSEVNEVQVNNANLNPMKVADVNFAAVGDTITYTIVLQNSGNTDATNVVFSDTIPNDTTFVADSVTLNGIAQPGANPESGITLGTISPNQVVTITFQVTVDTIPSPNPIENIGNTTFNYTVDPSVPDGATGNQSTNPANTEINSPIVESSKSADPEYATVGDTITYTIVTTNSGNTDAANLIITDTIPNDTTFVPDSVVVGNTSQPGLNPETGIPVGNLQAGETVTVTFQVIVDTIPSPNPIPNQARADFDFTVDPSVPNGRSGSELTNIPTTEVSLADITSESGGFIKSVDPTSATVGDTLTYTLVLTNNGNVTANNVVVSDTIPSGTTFIPNSVTVNGAPQAGANPQSGIPVGSIAPSETVTVTFQVVVDTVPTVNPIPNTADVAYDFTIDPADPNGASNRDESNEVTTQVNIARIENSDGGFVKSEDKEFVDIGDTITYTIVLQNTGNIAANNVVLTDTVPDGTIFIGGSVFVNGTNQPTANPEVGIDLGTINPGQVVTVMFQVTVTTIPTVNPIPNTAGVAYSFIADPMNPTPTMVENESNQVEAQVNSAIISEADGSLVKSVDPEFADVGDTLTYTIVMQNTGNVNANNVVFTDTIPNDTTFVTDSVTVDGVVQVGANPESGVNIGTIAPGQVVTIMFQVVVDSIPSPNPVENQGIINYDYTVDPSVPNGASSEDTTNTVDTQVNTAEISNEDGGLVKSATPEFATVGDTITYTIVLTNTGNTDANNVVFSDTIPNDTTFVPNSVSVNGVNQPGVNPESGISIGTISPGGVVTVMFQVVLDTIPSPNPIENQGRVAYDYTVDPSVPNGESKENLTNTEEVTVNEGNVDLTKVSDKDFAAVGETLTYTIVLTNTGNTAVNNVVFSDTIPNDTTLVPDSVTVGGGARPGENPEAGISVGTILPLQSVTITFQVTVDTVPSPNPIVNQGRADFTFTVDPSVPDGGSGSTLSNETPTQINFADLSNENGGIVKSVDPEFAAIGDTITYTIVLDNKGNVDANNVVFSDTIPSGTSFVANSVTVDGVTQPGANPQSGVTIGTIAPAQVVTITFQVVVTEIPTVNPVPNSGDVAYDFTVDPSIPNGESDRQESNTVDTQINQATIENRDGGLVKSVDPEFAAVGDTLTYTTVLRNTGNVPASNVLFSDTIPEGTSFVPGSVVVNGTTQPTADPEAGIIIGTINPGETVTISFTVVVDTIPTVNPIPNTSQVSYTYTTDQSVPDGRSETNDSNEVDSQINSAIIDPDVGGLVKSVDPEFEDVGDTITYTIVLNNSGNVNANNVVVTDTIPQGTTFVANSVTVDGAPVPGANPQTGITIATIAPGATATITFQVVVDVVPSPNPVPNSADVSYVFTVDPSVPNGASNRETSNEVDTQVNTASISNEDGGFVKSVDKAFVTVGETVTYTIVLTNTGNVNAENVVFSDTIPNDTSFVMNSVTVNGSTIPGVDPQSGISIGTIAPAEVVTVTFQVTVDTIPSPNPIENQAKTTYDYTVDPSVPNGASKEDLSNTVDSTVNNADISVEGGGLNKSVDPEFADVGDTITYTIVLQNTGNVPANNVVFSDTIPSGTTLVPDSVTLNGATLPGANPESGIPVGTIVPGAVNTITFQVVVDTIPSPNPVVNEGRVSYTFTSDPNNPNGESRENPTNPVDTQVNTAKISNEDGGLVKSANPEFADVGDTITFTIVLRNTGNTDANNVVLSDTIPNDTTFVTDSVTVNGTTQPGTNPESGINIGTIAPNEVVTLTFQVTVDTIPSPNPIQNEAVLNYTYTVDPSVPNGASDEQISNETDSQVNTAIISNRDGGFVKEVDNLWAKVGDTLTYTIVLRNTGNVTANNVVFSDTIPNDTTFVTDSVTVNGSTQQGANPQSGINIGSLGPNQVATVTFKVTVNTIPSPNPIPNQGKVTYDYTVDPSVPNGASDEELTNTVNSRINDANISPDDNGLVKSADRTFADIGDTITYTIVLRNTGNVDANNVVVSDTIPNDTSFVENSVTVNGSARPGENPQSGVPIGTIAPNEVVTVTFQVVVDTIPSPNPIQNATDVSYTFTVDPNDPDGESERNTSDPVDVLVNSAVISNLKSVDPEFASVGATLTYTVVLTNVGNVQATNVVFTDTIPGGTTLVPNSVTVNGAVQPGLNPENGVNIGNMIVGETITITFQVVVDTIPTVNPIPNKGEVSYSYTVDPTEPRVEDRIDETNTVETEINNADVTPIKSADPEFAAVGDTITYTVVLTNNGNVTANNVVITDTIPSATTFVPNSVILNGVVQNGADPSVGINIGNLSPGATATVTFKVEVVSIPTPNPTPNTADANYTFTSDPNNPNGEERTNTSNEADVQINFADISQETGGLIKSVDPQFGDIGDTLTYTITLTNNGNVEANNVVVTDTIPNDTTFVPNSVTLNGSTIAGANPQSGIPVGIIGAGMTATVTFQVVVDTIPSPNPIPNVANVAYTFTGDPANPDGQSANNESNEVTSTINHAMISPDDGGLQKLAEPDFVKIGDTITYTVVLRNTGNTDANSVVLQDTIPSGTTFVANSVTIDGSPVAGANPESGIDIGTINPNQTVTVTFEVVVNEIPVPNPIENEANVSYNYIVDPSGPRIEEAEETSNRTSTGVNDANISPDDGGFTKTASLDFADVGDTITYTIIATNTGNVPANNVVISDTIPNGTSLVANSVRVNNVAQPGANPQSGINVGTINPGQTVTVTFEVVVNEIPVPNPIVNTADVEYTFTVDPDDPDGERERNTTDPVTTQINNADISNENGGLIKTTTPEFVAVGDTITYTITLMNNGNVPANNVVLQDTIPSGTSFVGGSVTIDGSVQAGLNPQDGINLGTIGPADSRVVTFRVVVETIPSPNPIVNSADVAYTYTVDPANPDGVSNRETSNETENTVNEADISNESGGFIKSVDKDFADVGDTLTYSIRVENRGNVAANNVVVSDPIPSGTSFVDNSLAINGTPSGINPEAGVNLGSIQPGEVLTITFSVIVTEVPATNPIPNTANVQYTFTVNPANPNGASRNNDTNTVETQINNADISVEGGGLNKSVNPAFADIGDTITYTITLTNTGNVTANNVVVNDTIPNDTIFVQNSVTLNGVVQNGANPQSGINVGSIAPGASSTITFQVVVDTIPTPNPIVNTADVSYRYTVNPSNINGASDRNTTNEVETQVNTARISPDDGGLQKLVDPEFADIGDTITYTILLTNTGNVTANNVVITDTIPQGTSFISGSVVVNGTARPGDNPQSGISISSIAPNGTTTVVFQVLVESIPEMNPTENQAKVSYMYNVDPAGPPVIDEELTNIVDTQINSAIISNEDGGLIKSADKDFADVPDTITYTITLRNTGNVPANNVVVTDTIVDIFTFVDGSVTVNNASRPNDNPGDGINVGTIQPGGTAVVQFKVFVESIPNPNPVSNVSKVDYSYLVDPEENEVDKTNFSNREDVQINHADITVDGGGLDKIVDPEFADLGDTVTYTIVLRNTGNVVANNVIVTDTIPEATEFIQNSVTVNGAVRPGINPENGINVGSIQPGATVTVSFRVTVVSIPNNNPIENTARVEYDYLVDPNEPPVEVETLTDKEELKVNHGDISVEGGGFNKTVDPEFADINETITYTIVAENTGNVPVTNVIVSDTIPTGTTFIEDSVTVNGVSQDGINPQNGIALGTIDPGEVVTITFKVITETIPSPNPVENQAIVEYRYRVDPTEPPKEVENGSQIVDTQINNANLDGSRKISDTDFAKLGDTITYTIVIPNNGNVTANNVVFTDTIPTETTFVENSVTVNGESKPGENPQSGINVGSIGAGEVATITFMVTVESLPQSNPVENMGNITFEYTVDPNEPPVQGETVTDIDEINIRDANIIPEKSAEPEYVQLGDTITYTTILRNTGNVSANNVVFSDTIPEGTSFVENSVTRGGEVVDGANPENGVEIGTIEPGEAVVVTFMVLVDTLPDDRTIENIARVSYEFTLDPEQPPVNEENESNVVEVTANSVDFRGDNFTKSAEPEYAAIGDTITYSFFIRNAGNIAAEDVIFSDTIPEGTSLIEGSVMVDGDVVPNGNPEEGIEIGNIDPGQVVTLSFQVRVDTIPQSNPIMNIGRINYISVVDPNIEPIEGNSFSNKEQVQVNSTDIVIVKESVPCATLVGEEVTYKLTITNNGNVDATNFVLLDNLAPEVKFVKGSVAVNGVTLPNANPSLGIEIGTIKPSETVEVTFNVIALERPKYGTVENIATSNYRFIVDPNKSPRFGTTDSNVNVLPIGIAEFMVNKSADREHVTINDIITYSVEVKNIGSVKGENVIFKDDLPNGLEFVRNSFTVDGRRVNGVNIRQGVNLGDIRPKQVVKIEYQAIFKKACCPGNVINKAFVIFTARAADCAPPIRIESEPSSVTISAGISNFKQITVDGTNTIPCEKPAAEEVNDTRVDIEIISSNVVNTLKGTATSNQTLTGNKLVINGVIRKTIEYTADDPRQSVHSVTFEDKFSTFIILPEDHEPGSRVDVSVDVEDVYSQLSDSRDIFTNVTMLVKANVICF